jgi:hypothetical protein
VGRLLLRFFWQYWLFPFLDENRRAAKLEADLGEHGVKGLEREHAVFCEVFGKIDEELAVLSSEQSPSSFVYHFPTSSIECSVTKPTTRYGSFQNISLVGTSEFKHGKFNNTYPKKAVPTAIPEQQTFK